MERSDPILQLIFFPLGVGEHRRSDHILRPLPRRHRVHPEQRVGGADRFLREQVARHTPRHLRIDLPRAGQGLTRTVTNVNHDHLTLCFVDSENDAIDIPGAAVKQMTQVFPFGRYRASFRVLSLAEHGRFQAVEPCACGLRTFRID